MTGQIRIIGGVWRGRNITFHEAPGLRPTPNRVRETLFNWLGQTLPELTCLDLFAGGGALGFEALSRGAVHVVLVDSNAQTTQNLRENAQRLKAVGAEVVTAEAGAWLKGETRRFDVVFLDPPFAEGGLMEWLQAVRPCLAPGGVVYCESSEGVSESPLWMVIRSSRAGRVSHQLLEPVEGFAP